MSEAKQESAPKSKKGLLLIIIGIVLLVVLLLVGVLAFLLLRGNAAPQDEHAVEQVESQKPVKKVKKEEKAAPPVFERLGLFTVNLNSQESDEKMQVDLTVELSEEAEKAKLKLYQPKLQSAVIQLLRSKTPEEVKQPDSKEKLGLEIKDVLNKILEADGKDEGVLSVNFTSFIVA